MSKLPNGTISSLNTVLIYFGVQFLFYDKFTPRKSCHSKFTSFHTLRRDRLRIISSATAFITQIDAALAVIPRGYEYIVVQ
jgi:ABC-type glucose/galactose transport system permease subunit